ncbi:Hypothetical Protein A3768_3656 [Ralstonia solanacearum]|nr:Hypothetical Protein F504_66 [Ralstonia pseudosolanacearum FQY_4]ANH34770.1 Hypothetical Protein A3768_3656 [Ralstonia solanacearum]
MNPVFSSHGTPNRRITVQRLHRCADVAWRCHAVRSCYCAPRECVAGPRGGRWPCAHRALEPAGREPPVEGWPQGTFD